MKEREMFYYRPVRFEFLELRKRTFFLARGEFLCINYGYNMAGEMHWDRLLIIR